MESSLVLIIAAAVVLVVGWIIFKFFFRLLKHFVIALILAVIVAIAWYQPWNIFTPPQDPNIGKMTYGAISGNYLGKIVANDTQDNSWIIERNGIKTKYPKGRVVIK